MRSVGAHGHYVLTNHPSGDPTPSKEAHDLTIQMAAESDHVADANSLHGPVESKGRRVTARSLEGVDDALAVADTLAAVIDAVPVSACLGRFANLREALA